MSKHIDYEINRELGECYLFMGELDKAASYYIKAADCGTGSADPFLGLAAIAIQKGDIAEARGRYQAALDISPCDKALTGLALVELEQEELEQAFTHLGQALDINPCNLITLNSMLQLAHRLERMPEMLPRLRTAVSEGDHNALRFTLAGCLSALGYKDEAREHLEILLDRDPDNAEAQELYAQLAA